MRIGRQHVDARILSFLRAAGGVGVSGSDLAGRLGISRAAVWARIEELRRLGFEITAGPHKGYQLLGAPDRLIADDIISRLGRVHMIGGDVHVFRETNSTNDLAERLARDGAQTGTVVFAESQNKGRGRLGRNWHSPAEKGLWFSLVLRPKFRPQEATRLTITAATAIFKAVRNITGITLEIKWPNDLQIHGRKVAGILTEIKAELDSVRYAIIGIGVNVNLRKNEFPSALKAVSSSLLIESGAVVPRPMLAAEILRELDAAFYKLDNGGFGEIAEFWQRHCSTLGRHVSIRIGERTTTGYAEALDEEGALIIRSDFGHLDRVTGGDVSFV